MQLILCKDNANRVQKHQACLSVMPRCRLSYAKVRFSFHFSKENTNFCRKIQILVLVPLVCVICFSLFRIPSNRFSIFEMHQHRLVRCHKIAFGMIPKIAVRAWGIVIKIFLYQTWVNIHSLWWSGDRQLHHDAVNIRSLGRRMSSELRVKWSGSVRYVSP